MGEIDLFYLRLRCERELNFWNGIAGWGEKSEGGRTTFGNDDKRGGKMKFKLAPLDSDDFIVTWWRGRCGVKGWVSFHCWYQSQFLVYFGRDPRGVQGVGSWRKRLHLQTGAGYGHALSGLHAQRGGASHHHAETRHGRWVTWTPTDVKMYCTMQVNSLCCIMHGHIKNLSAIKMKMSCHAWSHQQIGLQSVITARCVACLAQKLLSVYLCTHVNTRLGPPLSCALQVNSWKW